MQRPVETPIRIRPARAGDADELGAVHVQAWQRGYAGLMPSPYLDALTARERAATWRRHLADLPEGNTVVVAIVDRRIAGFAAYGVGRDPAATDSGELHAINVAGDRWGRGVGSALIRHAEAGLAQAGYAGAILWVVRGNERALRFYSAHGWLPDGDEREIDVDGIALSEIRCAKTLR